jgi:hypothetical protein
MLDGESTHCLIKTRVNNDLSFKNIFDFPYDYLHKCTSSTTSSNLKSCIL